jgi:hypothetical protein
MSASGRWPVLQRDEEFADYLREAAPTPAKMFWRFITMARSCGAVTFELQRSLVVLCGSKRIFASVEVRPDGLRGHLNLAHQLPTGGRIRKAEQLTKKVYFHSFVVSSPGDLDDEFALLMCEARDVGDGQFPRE